MQKYTKQYHLITDFKHNADELKFISGTIKFILELIGKYSNERFGETAPLQDNFFQRKYEQETFFIHLFRAIHDHKAQQIGPVEIDGKMALIPAFGGYPLLLKRNEIKGKQYFKRDGQSYTEKQLYATAVYYTFPFVVKAIKDKDALYTAKLINLMHGFVEGYDYTFVNQSKGGEKSGVTRCKDKERGYELFIKEKIYENYGPKHEPMAFAICELLKKDFEINVAEDNVRTKWIPEFKGRREKALKKVE